MMLPNIKIPLAKTKLHVVAYSEIFKFLLLLNKKKNNLKV